MIALPKWRRKYPETWRKFSRPEEMMRFGPYGEVGYKETWAGRNPEASKTILILLLVALALFSPYLTLYIFFNWLALPVLGVRLPKIFRYYRFCNVPAKDACAYPRNVRRDILSEYFDTIEKVTGVWAAGVLVTFGCAVMLSPQMIEWVDGILWGHGAKSEVDFWSGRKSGIIFFAPLAVGGFIAVTGFLWWPMYAFFEWLTASKKLRALTEGSAYA